MELQKVSDSIYYIPGAINIGVIKNGKHAVLIDTGLDKNSGRLIRKTLESEGLTLKVIINTHSHADHFGGNDYLVRNLGAEVYAPKIESGIIENPILEPIYLFHGANPIKNLRNKFVLAKASMVHHVLEHGKTCINDKVMEIIPLPGHSFNQIGVLIDDVLFCADTVFSEKIIEKYKVPVVQDVGSHIKSLETLSKSRYSFYIPSHTKPSEDITLLIQKNSNTVDETLNIIFDMLDEPRTTTEIQSQLCNTFGLNLSVVQQYYLVHTTIMAYLSHLYEGKKIMIKLEDNTLNWIKS